MRFYIGYVTPDFYLNEYQGSVIPDEQLESAIIQASRHIDSLTFNRIVAKDFANLTEFQQRIIREVVCKQAEFEYQNKDIFDMILSGYSINGVSMQFGESWNVAVQNGIPIKRDTYDMLCQTGLCCRTLGAWY